MKKVIAIILALVMLLSVVPMTTGAAYKTPFEDVKTTDYFYEPVIWAYSEGITTGTTATKFAPQSTCTRGQVVTFLWRAMGKPEPATKTNPFGDVKESDYYYKPILWAVEKGITTGTSAKRFSPDVTCTNAHILTFIWRALGEEGKTGNGEWYTDAENWAKNGGLLEDTYTGTFDITAKCPRANVVTYLYKYLEADKLTVYVSANADAKAADGSVEKPFATIEAARDYVRTLDKSKYKGITVRINAGDYRLTAPIEFTKEDSGTENCPITYIGENGAIISGGVTLDPAKFAPASGKTAAYFPNAADVVMLDLKPYGITKDYVAAKYAQNNINYETLVPLYIDGTIATIARYPNEGYIAIEAGDIIPADKNAAKVEDQYCTVIDVNDEVAARIASWHDVTTVFTLSRHSALWRPNNYRMLSISGNTVTLPYGFDWYAESAYNTYRPRSGMPIVFENIPEELDVPGEYYVDGDAILYIYKTEDFNKAHISLPISDSAFTVKGADHIALKNLIIESFEKKAMTVEADCFTLDGCEIRGIGEAAISIKGNNTTVTNCEFHDLSFGILTIEGGDCDTLTRSGSIVYNNSFHDWGQIEPFYEPALNLKGCGITVSHNEFYNAGHEAITWEGNYHVIEYNDIHNVCNDTDDAGAIYSYISYAHYGNVIRYNYIHDIGLKDEFLANIKDYVYCGVSAIYWDGGKSGQTAEHNIIENVTGVGVAASGRDETVTNNLFISCGWSVSMVACYYQGTFVSGTEKTNAGGQGLFNLDKKDAWKKAFPQLYTLNWDKEDPDDPNFYGAPTNNILQNNYYYFDKANMNSIKWYGHMFPNDIHESVKKFSGNTIEEAVEGVNMTTYTSKRQPITAADVIEETSKITGITMEEFNKIGRLD